MIAQDVVVKKNQKHGRGEEARPRTMTIPHQFSQRGSEIVYMYTSIPCNEDEYNSILRWTRRGERRAVRIKVPAEDSIFEIWMNAFAHTRHIRTF